MSTSKWLNVAQLLPRSHANGPGVRMVLWVQGCPFRCPGCQNPDYLTYIPRQFCTVDEVWAKYLAEPGLSGISFSGGEPFAQADALADLAWRVRSNGGTVVVWTGYTIEVLEKGEIQGAKALLKEVDLLIDGQYKVKENLQGVPLRGSANQRLLFLSGKIQKKDTENLPSQEWILDSDKLVYTGFPLTMEATVCP